MASAAAAMPSFARNPSMVTIFIMSGPYIVTHFLPFLSAISLRPSMMRSAIVVLESTIGSGPEKSGSRQHGPVWLKLQKPFSHILPSGSLTVRCT